MTRSGASGDGSATKSPRRRKRRKKWSLHGRLEWTTRGQGRIDIEPAGPPDFTGTLITATAMEDEPSRVCRCTGLAHSHKRCGNTKQCICSLPILGSIPQPGHSDFDPCNDHANANAVADANLTSLPHFSCPQILTPCPPLRRPLAQGFTSAACPRGRATGSHARIFGAVVE